MASGYSTDTAMACPASTLFGDTGKVLVSNSDVETAACSESVSPFLSFESDESNDDGEHKEQTNYSGLPIEQQINEKPTKMIGAGLDNGNCDALANLQDQTCKCLMQHLEGLDFSVRTSPLDIPEPAPISEAFKHVDVDLPKVISSDLCGIALISFDGRENSPYHIFPKSQLTMSQVWTPVVPSSAEETKEDRSLAKGVIHRYTTVTMQGLPRHFKKDSLLSFLDARGLNGKYDFVYLPLDFKRAVTCRGYAIVNMVSHEDAWSAIQDLTGFKEWDVSTTRVLNFCWSDTQGLEEHVELYRDSPVMHEVVPDEYKPSLFHDGTRVPFPAPSRRIRPPNPWRTKMAAEAAKNTAAKDVGMVQVSEAEAMSQDAKDSSDT